MKKMVTVLGISVMSVSLLGAMNVSAVEVANESTITSAEFTAPVGGEGALTLDRVGDLEFGSNEIAKEDRSYAAISENVIEVADLRGTLEGWNLQVSQSALVSKDSETELVGTTIDLENGTIDSSNVTVSVDRKITIHPTNEKTLVLNAAEGQGNGLTKVTFAKENIHLNVPGGKALAEQYSSTLTWTLVDAPNA